MWRRTLLDVLEETVYLMGERFWVFVVPWSCQYGLPYTLRPGKGGKKNNGKYD